jgi:hypothetical protein
MVESYAKSGGNGTNRGTGRASTYWLAQVFPRHTVLDLPYPEETVK